MAYRTSLILALCFVCGGVWASIVAPSVVTLTQPDGTSFEASPQGDEFGDWMETLDGYTIVEENGTWYYAVQDARDSLIASPNKVGTVSKAALATWPRHLRPPIDPRAYEVRIPRSLAEDGAKTLTHTQYVVVILVEYSGTPSTTFTYSDSSFQSLIFGASSSVKDFFLENSYNNFTVTPASESYGTANDGIIHITRGISHPDLGNGDWRSEASSIMSGADGSINYASFDSDASGTITEDELAIVIILAGYENAYGGSNSYTPRVWGHAWQLSSALYLDGVYLQPYTMFGERHWQSGEPSMHQATIGIMCHELGHLMLNLPDLYDTDNTSEGIGEWGLMGSGNWLYTGTYQGDSPAHLSAWCKAALDITTPTDIMASATGVSVLKGDSNASIKRLWIDKYRLGEYFLVENRQLSGYDAGLPGAGLMIWHCDDRLSSNTNESHKMVDVEAADGYTHLDSKTNRGDTGDPFPGSSSNTTFNNTSTPDSKDYNSASTGIAVTNISSSAATMTADMTPSSTGGTGDYLRYDDGRAPTAGLSWGDPTYTAVQYTNSTSMDTLDGFEVYVTGSGTIDFYLYQSMVSDIPNTLLHTETGFSASYGWNRFLLSTPQSFPSGQDRVIVLALHGGTNSAQYDSSGTIDDRSWIGYSLSVAFWSMHTGDSYPGDLCQVALFGAQGPPNYVYVDFAWSGSETGASATPYNTLGEAVSAVSTSGTVRIKSDTATSTSTEMPRITKAMRIEAVPAGSVRIGVAAKEGGQTPSRNTAEAGGYVPMGADTSGVTRGDSIGELQGLVQLYLAATSDASGTPTAADGAGVSDGEAVLPDGRTREYVLPFTEAGAGLRTAQDDSILAIRLRAATDIDVDSIWCVIEGYRTDGYVVTGRPVEEGSLRDVWVIVESLEGWTLDDQFVATAGASTVTGDAIEPATYRFQVESAVQGPIEPLWQPQYDQDFNADGLDLTEESGDTVVITPGEQMLVEPLAGGLDTPFVIDPEQVYDQPQRIWLPLPRGTDANGVRVYYYHATGEDRGWYPAESVDGWLVADSYLHLEIKGTDYLGFVVRHGGIVQLGLTK